LAALKTLLSWLALLFHLLFSLSMTSLGVFGFAAGARHLRLEMLPWSGSVLAEILLFGGLFGLLSVILAIRGKLRFLFLVWSLALATMLTKALIFSGYRFLPGEWRRGLYLVVCAWLAAVGAFCGMRALPAPGRPARYRVK
jgi:hypothetical protein